MRFPSNSVPSKRFSALCMSLRLANSTTLKYIKQVIMSMYATNKPFYNIMQWDALNMQQHYTEEQGKNATK